MTGEPIRILSENPREQVWTHLSRWESKELAKRLLAERAERSGTTVDGAVIDAKATALTHCLRSAREYLEPTPSAWTTRVVGDYYGCLWLVSAEMVADPTSKYDLDQLEATTKFGHGLTNIDDEAQPFPRGQLVSVLGSGLFASYLKFSGLTKEERKSLLPSKARPRLVSDLDVEDRAKLVSLADLFARVPEVGDIYQEIMGRPAYCFHVFHSDRNMSERSRRMREKLSPAQKPGTWVGVRSSATLAEEFLRDHGPPLADWNQYAMLDGESPTWTGWLDHPEGEYWYKHLSLYKSPMTGTTWTEPLLGVISDPMAIHYMLLYTLSILTRYRPKLWRRISEGDLDYFLGLVRYYLEAYERMAPQLALERITQRTVSVAQPGSLWAPS